MPCRFCENLELGVQKPQRKQRRLAELSKPLAPTLAAGGSELWSKFHIPGELASGPKDRLKAADGVEGHLRAEESNSNEWMTGKGLMVPKNCKWRGFERHDRHSAEECQIENK